MEIVPNSISNLKMMVFIRATMATTPPRLTLEPPGEALMGTAVCYNKSNV
jgi:hypothetical protein